VTFWEKGEKMDRKEILERMKAADIDTLRIDFSDMYGITRSKIVPAKRLDEVLEEGINCAKPTFSLDLAYNIPPGTGTADEVNYEDMAIIPDPDTLSGKHGQIYWRHLRGRKTVSLLTQMVAQEGLQAL
jgi:glutamine synthetase